MNDSHPHEQNPKPIESWMCGAKTKSGNGSPCRRPKAIGRTRCPVHGGKTPIGPDAPSFKHGAKSKLAYLRPELQIAAQQTIANANRLDLTEHLAVLTAVEAEALQDWGQGGGGDAWIELRDLRTAYLRETKKGKAADGAVMKAAIDQIMAVIESGSARVSARREVQDAVESYRRVADTERKRNVALRAMVTVEELMAILGKLGDILVRNIPDRDVRQRVVGEMQKMLMAFYVNDRGTLPARTDQPHEVASVQNGTY